MQKPSTQSPTQPTQASRASNKLHPVLQNVLISMDVPLEEELIRYRRQRALGKTSYQPPDPSFRKIANALKSVSGSTSPLSLPTFSQDGASSHLDVHSNIDLPPFTATPPSWNDSTTDNDAQLSRDTVHYEEATVNEDVLHQEQYSQNHDLSNRAEESPDSTSENSAIELNELAKQYASQIANSSLTVSDGGVPDDYLESSEELLRALSHEESEVQAEQSFMHSLFTPLGFGSMLLLLLSSAMFGFVITNPSSVSQLFASQEAPPPVNSENTSASSSPSPQSAATLPQPNLVNQEFPELSVATLGSIKVDSKNELPTSSKLPTTNAPAASGLLNIGLSGTANPTPQSPTATIASPGNQPGDPVPSRAPSGDIPSPKRLAPTAGGSTSAPVVRSNPSPARSYVPAPQVRSYTPAPPARTYNPAPVTPSSPPPTRAYRPTPIQPFRPTPSKSVSSPSSDRSSPSQASTASSTSPSSGNGYRVVSPYTSDRALEDARQTVPDAYVKNYPEGAKVQFGAYSDEAAAKAQAEALQKQGIPAEVYKP